MENRLQMIFDASSHLFINKGYSRTQIKDIAREIGLSTGMLYVYFTGKRDILNFILKGTIEPTFVAKEFALPIQSALFDSLDTEIKVAFEENMKTFSSHLAGIADYPFENMLSDAYDVISRYGIGCLLIEKNPDDLGNLIHAYKAYRLEFHRQIVSYITHYRENGTFRQVEYPEYTAQAMIEIMSWWGMHVTNDAFEIQKDITAEIAKKICMDNLLHAYSL